jgi:hypothetical protein
MNIPQVATSMQGHDALAESGFKFPVLSSEGKNESGNWKIVGSESQVNTGDAAYCDFR